MVRAARPLGAQLSVIIQHSEGPAPALPEALRPVRRDRRGGAPLLVVCLIGLSPGLLGASAAWASATSTTTLTLEEAYARAKSRSLELLTARERIVQAELQVDRAWALLKPNLSASLTYTHTEPRPEPLSFPNFFSITNVAEPCGLSEGSAGSLADPACRAAFQAEVERIRTAPPTTFDFAQQNTALFRAQITWNILNGRALPLLANAEDGVRLEGHRQEADTARLMLTVARAYLGAIAADDTVEVARRAEARARARVALAEERARVGEQIPKILEVERLGLTQASLDVRRAANVAAQARLALAFTLGDHEAPGVLVRPSPPQPPREALEQLVAEARAQRGDVHVARVALEVAERGRTDAWWKFAPTVGLFAGFRYTNVSGLSGQNDEWSVGANLQWLLYDGGLRYADLAEAESQVRVAQATLERAERLVGEDLVRARLKLESAEVGVARAQALRELATARSALVRTQAEAGAARPLELQESEDTERDAESALVSATLERDAAVLELLNAVGRFRP
jgi:outer membrane protein TolC